VTGEEKYLAKAREILLGVATWHFEPDWKAGDVVGATDITYNDEAHFRLWRKLPLVYDQLREKLSAADRATILAHFKIRGDRSVAWIEKEGDISKTKRNSIASDISSHPVRFMPMTGLTALALWDDLPAAREWWAYAYKFYRDQFSPWGGDDGGWAEGNAYWRGTFEHAAFQDTLLALGDPLAYASPFWKNSRSSRSTTSSPTSTPPSATSPTPAVSTLSPSSPTTSSTSPASKKTAVSSPTPHSAPISARAPSTRASTISAAPTQRPPSSSCATSSPLPTRSPPPRRSPRFRKTVSSATSAGFPSTAPSAVPPMISTSPSSPRPTAPSATATPTKMRLS